MAALAAPRVTLVPKGTIKKTTFPLKIGVKAWDGGMCCIDSAVPGSVIPGAVSTTLKAIGKFLSTVDNTAGAATVPVGVELTRERELEYWDSVTGAGAVTTANLFAAVYIASDHEVSTVGSGASVYGIVWAIGPQGAPGAVGVEPLF